MLKRLSLSAAALCLSLSAVAAPAMAAACFTPDEAKAAHFRIMKEEFNVAALNCRTVDPSDPTFSDRYNAFVGRFGGKLQENAQALRRHFSRAGGNLDVWMTKVANDAGQRVFTDGQYCQTAWENLDKVMVVAPEEVDGFATNAVAARSSMVPLCSEAKAKPARSRHGHKKQKVAKAE